MEKNGRFSRNPLETQLKFLKPKQKQNTVHKNAKPLGIDNFFTRKHSSNKKTNIIFNP